MTYLLDTNICVDALKHRPPEVLERLEVVGRGAVALSVITVLEEPEINATSLLLSPRS